MQSSDFSLVFISGSEAEPQLKNEYKMIYRHWDSIWSQTFREIHEEKSFFSDHFTRQGEIMGLIYNGECIAACCHRLADMSLTSFQNDSYFQAWPEQAISKLRQHGDLVVIDNQISVDPRYRKLQNGIRFIELMTYLTFRHLSCSNAASITAASRNTRSMNSVFEKFSPELLAKDVIFHGESTSLYALYPFAINFDQISNELKTLGDSLLSKAQRSSLIHPFFSTQLGEAYAHKSTSRVA